MQKQKKRNRPAPERWQDIAGKPYPLEPKDRGREYRILGRDRALGPGIRQSKNGDPSRAAFIDQLLAARLKRAA